MRNNVSVLVAIGALLWSGSSVVAQPEPVALRYAFTEGQSLSVRFEETNASHVENLLDPQKSTQKSSFMHCTETWVVRKVAPNGDATIELKFDTAITRTRLESGEEFVFDTQRSLFDTNPWLQRLSAEEKAEMKRLDALRQWMTAIFTVRTMTFTVSSLGKVTNVVGFSDEAWDEWRAKIGEVTTDRETRATLDAQANSVFGTEALVRTFNMSFFVGLPARAVRVGEEWSDATEFAYAGIRLPMNRRYKFLGVSGPTGAATLRETTVYSPPVVPPEITVRQNENLMTADITLDPTGKTLVSRTYTGIADIDVYRGASANSQKIGHNVTSVKGTVWIVDAARTKTHGTGQSTDPARSTASAPTRAAVSDFSAKVLWASKVSGRQQWAQVYVRGNRTRVDPIGDASLESVYVIADRETQTIVAVFPKRRVYTRESTISGTGPWAEFHRMQIAVFNNAQPCAVFPLASKCTYVGEGTLAGRAVATWQAMQAVDGRVLVGHAWVDARLGAIVKVESPGGSIELLEIREGSPPADLFAIPNTYKLETP